LSTLALALGAAGCSDDSGNEGDGASSNSTEITAELITNRDNSADVETVLAFGAGGGPEGDPFEGYTGPRIIAVTEDPDDFSANVEPGETATFRLEHFDGSSVVVAVFDTYAAAGGNLLASVDVDLDGGAATLSVEAPEGTSGQCYAVVADPDLAAADASNITDENGNPLSEFGNPYDARVCII
jgi:hypothetical protein